MGLFTFMTAETKRPIPVVGSGAEPFVVYLLRPGEDPVRQSIYRGDGKFGGIDAYQWCGEANAPHLGMDPGSMTSERLRQLGVFLTSGEVFRDIEGQLWVVGHDYEFLANNSVKRAPGNFGTPVEPGGLTPNELIANGDWHEVSPDELGWLRYPIKLVEDALLEYGDVGPSLCCRSPD